MKKLLTLLLAVTSFTISFAQSRKIDEARRVMNGTPNDRTVYDERGSRVPGGSGTSRSEDIDKVNYEYERKINAVRMNPTLSQAEKERRIRKLEDERERRINSINHGKNDKDRKKAYTKNKGKGNNGRHLGWEKGVGNPHRDEGDYKQGKRKHDDDRKNGKKYKQKNKNK